MYYIYIDYNGKDSWLMEKTFDYGQSPEPQSAQVWRNRQFIQYGWTKKELKKNKKIYRTLFT